VPDGSISAAAASADPIGFVGKDAGAWYLLAGIAVLVVLSIAIAIARQSPAASGAQAWSYDHRAVSAGMTAALAGQVGIPAAACRPGGWPD
jgi:hypothetical protein